jgi:VWFA-related protein
MSARAAHFVALQFIVGILLALQPSDAGSGIRIANEPGEPVNEPAIELATEPASPDPARALSPRHESFLQQVDQLITPTEREVFLALSADYRRDEFVRRFWRVRDPFPETPRNELLDRWEVHLQVAQERYPDLEDERARFLLVHGPAQSTLAAPCERLRELEVWRYARSPLVPHEFSAVFVRRGARFHLWSPSEGLRSLVVWSTALGDHEAALEIQQQCSRGEELMAAMSISPDWSGREWLPAPNDEWARSFLARSTELPDGVEALPVAIDVTYPGRHQSRTVVQAAIGLAASDVTSHERGGRRAVSLLVDGEVVRGEELFDSFRYRFDLPLAPGQAPSEPAGGPIAAGEHLPVIVERFLRPGEYRMVLKVQDLGAETVFRAETELSVPVLRVDHAATSPGTRLGLDLEGDDAGAPTPSRAAMLATEPVVRLRGPSGDLAVGRIRVSALAQGEGIARVGFELNGQPLLSKARAPFDVELDVGRVPRRHVVRAIAYAADGRELAADQVELNAGPHRFGLRLVEPRRGGSYQGVVRAAAEVEVPRLERLDRVEFFLNETLVATLYQPPFVQPIAVPSDLPLGYVRAVGWLENGASVEDIVFVNAPDEVEHLDVNFVELYTTVSDRRGRSVEGLTAEEFRVLEDGRDQAIRRFELVRDLPVHAGVMLDLSTSMIDRLVEAREAALHFFEQVITERDRACLMTFNDTYQLVVGFTNSVELLAGGLADLVAEGETALYDSLIQALFYFHGLKGKRALVLLTDGEDSKSQYRYEEVLEFARHSRVAIYAIGLGIDYRDVDVRSRLTRLCEETGGRCSFVDSVRELPAVYGSIQQELRSQYLIAYQSDGEGRPGDGFRTVDLRVGRGLKARTMRGYYP